MSPILDYVCYSCYNKEEKVITTQDIPVQICRVCGKVMTKQVSKPGRIIMGDSLYDTSKDIADGLAGKPYKGKYHKEDDDVNMG